MEPAVLTRQQGLGVTIVFHSDTHPIRMLTNKDGVPGNDVGVGYNYMPIGPTSDLFSGVEIPRYGSPRTFEFYAFRGSQGRVTLGILKGLTFKVAPCPLESTIWTQF
jgi:hypothetical protein